MDEPTTPRPRLTLRDLAASLGVSKTTVSNAFSRPDQLSPELRDRVLEAARAAGYAGPDPLARMLMTRRAGAIGLILPESLPFALDDPVASELIRGIADACEERRLGLLVVPGGIHAADPRMITDVAVDGFVAYSLPHGSSRLEAALGRGVPLVVVDQPRLPGVATVVLDDAGAAREAARHLLALGHRRFGIVALPCHPDGYTGPGDPARLASSVFDVTAARFAGYADALAEAGVAIEGVPFFECAHGDEALGAAAARHLFALRGPPDRRPGDERSPGDRRHGGGPRGGARRPGRRLGHGLRRHRRGRPCAARADHGAPGAPPQGLCGGTPPARRPGQGRRTEAPGRTRRPGRTTTSASRSSWSCAARPRPRRTGEVRRRVLSPGEPGSAGGNHVASRDQPPVVLPVVPAGRSTTVMAPLYMPIEQE